MHGFAAAGHGKSPTIKPLIQLLLHALHEETCQSSTTAAAIEKVRATSAYLLLHSDDAGRCVSIPVAQGGKTNRGEHVDLTYFFRRSSRR